MKGNKLERALRIDDIERRKRFCQRVIARTRRAVIKGRSFGDEDARESLKLAYEGMLRAFGRELRGGGYLSKSVARQLELNSNAIRAEASSVRRIATTL